MYIVSWLYVHAMAMAVIATRYVHEWKEYSYVCKTLPIHVGSYILPIVISICILSKAKWNLIN